MSRSGALSASRSGWLPNRGREQVVLPQKLIALRWTSDYNPLPHDVIDDDSLVKTIIQKCFVTLDHLVGSFSFSVREFKEDNM